MGTPIYTLTPNAARQLLQNDGLVTLGLTTVALSPHWGTLNVTAYDPTTQRLTCAGQITAPYRGILQGAFAPASSSITADLPKNGTTITVAQGDGANFPTPDPGTSVVLTLSNASGSKREHVACTALNGDTFTIQRGYEGSAAQEFSQGDRVSLRLGRNNSSTQFSDVAGQPIQATCAVYRLHPQAAFRLERLMSNRYDNGGPVTRPVPVAMVVYNVGHYMTDQFFEADDTLLTPGSFQFSFHDRRGMIVDPIYVAAVFADLIGQFPALQPVGGAFTDNGGLNAVLALGTGTVVHFVDPHGATFTPRSVDMTPTHVNGWISALPQNTPIKAATNNSTLRWGWATNGLMTANDLNLPANTANLLRQFFRVCVVDTEWSLVGNRTAQEVLGVRGDDTRIPAEFLPEVRDNVDIDYLIDGPDTLAEVTRILQPVPAKDFMVGASMLWDDTMLTPGQLGAPGHWPNFPAPLPVPPGAITALPNALPAGSVTANQAAQNSQDVVVTLTGVVPFDAHVRIYPVQFVEIEAVGPEPSFVRGDGGATIAPNGPVAIQLSNPFNLAPNQALPSPAVLTLDIVITPRMGVRRLFGAVSVSVVPPPPANAPNMPFTSPAPVPLVPAMFEGIAPSPLFGVPLPAPPPPPNTSSVLGLLLSFVAESMPRQAPRLPTMARFETLAASGISTGANQPLAWEAVVTGARWAPESRSALHAQGNPGNPAGADLHAPGVHVTGALAYDVAYAALKRAQPMTPWPGTTLNFIGWLAASMGDNFNPPSDAPNPANTGTGVLLRTVAKGVESSMLADKQVPSMQDLDQNDWIEKGLDQIGIDVDVDLSLDNEDRLKKEFRREFYISTNGLRDSQWSLLRAFHDARELVYIESPQFARTARPGQNAALYELDLVQVLADRLAAAPNLRILICTPKHSDFVAKFKSWAHQHYIARTEAANKLLSVAPDRVAIFHPVGFPGRTAFIRTTSIIVDDVWALVGSTHFRRRGMTFDGSAAIASFDRQLENGYSKKVQEYRQALMAAKLRVATPTGNVAPTADWIRLGRPEGSFALVQDLLEQGGLGRIEPLWPGPMENVTPQDPDVADPDGSTSDHYLTMTTFAGVLNEAGS